MGVSSSVARASKKVSRPRPPTSPFIGVDAGSKRSAFYAEMTKKKYGPGGPSRRGSHAMSNAGGCEVRFYWSEHVGLQPAGGRRNFYMDFGTLGHTAMAYFYADKMERKPLWLAEFPDRDKAMHADAEGNPKWLRDMNDLMGYYKKYEAGDPWEPLYIEEEFEARVGDIDPNGQDEAAFDLVYEANCDDLLCSNKDENDQHIAHKVQKTLHFPSLNDELVTCRPDMLIRRNGFRWIIDHKFLGGGKNDPDRLAIVNDQYPDYTYAWQQMVNLIIVRKGRCIDFPGDPFPVQGFILNRIKRNSPFDVSRDHCSIATRMYGKIPATIRDTVRRSRELKRKSVLAPGSLIAHPWECEAKWKCDFTRICYTNDITERDGIIATEFATKE